MVRVGDVLVGTRWPLRLRVVADPSKPRTLGRDGRVTFTIGSYEVYSEDRRIVSPAEQRIAIFLALYGDWAIRESPAEIDDNQLVAIEHHLAPPEDSGATMDQGFDFVGVLSSMISNQHKYSTADGGQVVGIRSQFEPGAVGALIPSDYEGKALPLWRIHVQAGAPK
jgi:hypothetical protein